KTSVALQRVAYLLYKHRGSLHADNMVLFSPNLMFISYVSAVLPELGEINMQQTTFQDYLRKRLGSRFSMIEDPYDQLEAVLTSANDARLEIRLEAVRYKASDDFFTVVQRYLDRLPTAGM